MQGQKLTNDQQKQIEMILNDYRTELDKILADHNIKVKEILDRMDQDKMRELLKAINKTT